MYGRAVKLYFVVVVITVVVILAGFIVKPQSLVVGDISDNVEIAPIKTEQVTDSERNFDFDFSDSIGEEGRCLNFKTLHSEVKVYADERLIYEIKTYDTHINKTPGVYRNCVLLPDNTQKAKVFVDSVYESTNNKKITFYLGRYEKVIEDTIRSSFLEVVVSLLDIAVGIFLILSFLICKKHSSISNVPLYLGIFATTVGLWAFNETNFSSLLVLNRSAASNMAFMLLMNAVPVMVLFAKEYNNFKKGTAAAIVCAYCYINQLVILILHVLGIRSIKENDIFIHISILIGFAYFISAIVYNIKINGINRTARVNMFATAILIVSTAVDLFLYYNSILQVKYTGRMGLLIYLCIIGFVTISDTVTSIDEGKKAAIYKELAETDRLAGVFNRNKYMEWEKEHLNDHTAAIVNFDLNNLKYYNDTYGHIYGDQYIMDAAEIIKSTFEGIGLCCRVGGDEFCVAMENFSEDTIKERLRLLEEKQSEYNSKSEIINMQIAYGYAVYDGAVDENIEKTRSRSDARMYEKKALMKEESCV